MNIQQTANSPQEIARRIREQVKFTGHTMGQMLNDLNLAENTVSKLAKGNGLSYLEFARIAGYLGCSTDYLLGRTDNKTVSIDNQGQSFQGTQTNVISAESSPRVDSMTTKFLEIFNTLDFQDQLDTMNFVMERSKK